MNPFHPWLKRLVNRRALLREKPWSIGSDVETVFEANAELTIDHDCWLVAETHAGLDRRLVAANEVGPLVTVESDTMPGAMRQSRDFVVWPKPGISNHFARRGIDGLTRRPNFRCGKPCILRLLFKVPDLSLSISRLAK